MKAPAAGAIRFCRVLRGEYAVFVGKTQVATIRRIDWAHHRHPTVTWEVEWVDIRGNRRSSHSVHLRDLKLTMRGVFAKWACVHCRGTGRDPQHPSFRSVTFITAANMCKHCHGTGRTA